MAGHKNSGIYNGIKELTDVRKCLVNKNPVFVPLNGLSQSAKDRRMNNRTVRQPKNINVRLYEIIIIFPWFCLSKLTRE